MGGSQMCVYWNTKRPSHITSEKRIPVDWNFVDDKDLGI
jgi:hypothetical protein